MKEDEVMLNPNKLVQYLKKPQAEFQREDVIKFIVDNRIEMINFRYVAEDGKLKTVNFIINSKEHLETLFSIGERVDGSSLFSHVEAGSSDLYVIPRFKTAFVNPFSEIPTVDLLCSYYTREGRPLEIAPEHILRKAHAEFQKATGLVFKAMGEVEYYVICDRKHLYPGEDQRGYHGSQPFSRWEHLRREAMHHIAACGGKIKYGHSEVGNFITESEEYEQHEIEFLPVEVEDAADHIVLAKWVLRMLGNKYGVNVSFAPKISIGKAGSGLHIHMLVEKDGVNQMTDNHALSATARNMIAGLLSLAAPLTAFGNTIPTSYLRLVPHQEAPTNICWGDRNRSALVRVPLGWVAKTSMIRDANPQEAGTVPYVPGMQTIEFRVPDGAADVYHLLAAIVVACTCGFEMPNATEYADRLYVSVNIFQKEFKELARTLEHLPTSCADSADRLEKSRTHFEKNGVFPKATIERFLKHLRSFSDRELSERLSGNQVEIKKLVDKYLHWM
jgi:glutamine synthetase